jgi:amidase
MLGVIAGADPNDPTALRAAVPNYLVRIGDGVRGLRIGVDRRYTQDGVDAQVVAALLEAERTLADLGAEIREVRFPSYEKLVSQWIPMCSVETAEAHLETYPSRKSEYGPDLAQLIEQGRSVSGVEIAAIHHERLKFSGSLAALFEDIDLLLVPTMPMPIPTLAKMGEYGADPSVLLSILRFTAVFDFSGSPTITLPMGMASDRMPLSMQLVGPHLSEDMLVRAGHAFQSMTDWHTQRPPIR